MNDFKLEVTDQYERLVKFFVENQLEFDGDEEVDTDIVKCWKAEAEDDKLAGGCVLAMRQGKYIIDGIAVDSAMRKFGLGRLLINKAKEEVLSRGGDAIYLVARAPEFFRRLGFETIPADNAPNFFECKYCPQYGTECHPEIMKLDLK